MNKNWKGILYIGFVGKIIEVHYNDEGNHKIHYICYVCLDKYLRDSIKLVISESKRYLFDKETKWFIVITEGTNEKA